MTEEFIKARADQAAIWVHQFYPTGDGFGYEKSLGKEAFRAGADWAKDYLANQHEKWCLDFHIGYQKMKADNERLGKEVEELMKVDYWQDRYNNLKKESDNKIKELEAELDNQKPLFTSRVLVPKLEAEIKELVEANVALIGECAGFKSSCLLSQQTAADLAKERDRYKKALDLALYYVNGDATWEGVKMKVDKILKGESI